MTTRISALVAAFAVLGGALTACGSGPSQVNSAVIIGDQVVSVDDVQRRLDEALRVEPAAKEIAKNHKLDLVSRGIVNQIVRHELLEETARREGLSVSEKDLSDLTAGTRPAEDPLARAVEAGFDQRELARDRLLLQSLAQRFANRLQITVDAAQVISPANARKQSVDLANRLAKVKPEEAAGEIEKQASQEITPVRDFQVNVPATFGIFAQNQVSLLPVLSARANTVVAFPLASGEQAGTAGWFVGYVKQRSDNATLASNVAALIPQISPEWLQQVGLHLISPLANELGVRINPRYGIWDELEVGVVPNEGEKFGVVVPVASARP